MLNEHHQTATCMNATSVVSLSVLARQTKRARLLILGYPIGHRPDPLRAAEELSTIDVVSRGRLDMGFIKGVPYEFAPSNANPVGVMDRFWEAHDFIIKAMTSHDAPFNWESEHFHYRQVNIWPRPWQQPHPPVWSTTASKTNARVLGERGYVMAILGSGYATKALFDAYREGYASTHNGAMPGPDRFAYLALFATARDEKEARRRGELVAAYLRTGANVYPPFKNPPGYLSVDDNVRLLRGMTPERSFTKEGRVIDMRTGSLQDLIELRADGLRHARPVLPADHRLHRVHRRASAICWSWRRAATSITRTPPTASRCWRRRSCRGCKELQAAGGSTDRGGVDIRLARRWLRHPPQRGRVGVCCTALISTTSGCWSRRGAGRSPCGWLRRSCRSRPRSGTAR